MQDIRYSPSFHVFRNGNRVDEFYGGDVQKMRDRMWLHNDRPSLS
jgi:thioredoxin 1